MKSAKCCWNAGRSPLTERENIMPIIIFAGAVGFLFSGLYGAAVAIVVLLVVGTLLAIGTD